MGATLRAPRAGCEVSAWRPETVRDLSPFQRMIPGSVRRCMWFPRKTGFAVPPEALAAAGFREGGPLLFCRSFP